jgi:hypothetical protein
VKIPDSPAAVSSFEVLYKTQATALLEISFWGFKGGKAVQNRSKSEDLPCILLTKMTFEEKVKLHGETYSIFIFLFGICRSLLVSATGYDKNSLFG